MTWKYEDDICLLNAIRLLYKCMFGGKFSMATNSSL